MSDSEVPQGETWENVYARVDEYRTNAKQLLENEEARDAWITESSLIMLQMERDMALTKPDTRSEAQAAIRSRDNFVKKATELLTLVTRARELRLKVIERELELTEAKIEAQVVDNA